MLSGRRVLVAEDEPFTALDLAEAVRAADGEVVGPVASVRDGLALIEREEVHAAILDVRLADGLVAPVAAALLEKGKVVIFHTASPVPPEIVHRYGEPTICPKPMHPQLVVRRLADIVNASPKPPETLFSRGAEIDAQVGRRLRGRRRQLGMSQSHLAVACGVRSRQLRRYEAGTQGLSAARLWIAAHHLGVPVRYFFEGLIPGPPLRRNVAARAAVLDPSARPI